MPPHGWWFHLRRCAQCGHIGCCDDSPAKHATAHAKSTGHPIIRSFEPGEAWFWNFDTSELYETGPDLAPPLSHPKDQPTPGPAGRVPHELGEHAGLTCSTRTFSAEPSAPCPRPRAFGGRQRTEWPYISPKGSARSSTRAPSGSRK